MFFYSLSFKKKYCLSYFIEHHSIWWLRKHFLPDVCATNGSEVCAGQSVNHETSSLCPDCRSSPYLPLPRPEVTVATPVSTSSAKGEPTKRYRHTLTTHSGAFPSHSPSPWTYWTLCGSTCVSTGCWTICVIFLTAKSTEPPSRSAAC